VCEVGQIGRPDRRLHGSSLSECRTARHTRPGSPGITTTGLISTAPTT
jgi:hypothetical protein